MEKYNLSEICKRRALCYFFQAGCHEEEANETFGHDREEHKYHAHADLTLALFMLKAVEQ